MFTDCPGCQRQFHIYANQLSSANGQVKCGYCGRQFNALGRLRDEPLKPGESQPNEENSSIELETGPVQAPVDPNDIAATDREPLQRPVDHDSFAEVDNASEGSPDPLETIEHISGAYDLIAETGEPGSDTGPQFHLHQDDESTEEVDVDDPEFISRENQEGHDTKPDTVEEIGVELDELPEALLEEIKPRTSLLSRLFWSFIIVILVFFACIQVAWFQRDELIVRYPELIPWVDKVCVQFECEVIRFRDVTAITLINRDVREHPRYENALLVNATMSNQSHTRQVFPDIQLSLYGTDGDLIGHRTFSPVEYLDGSINRVHGMAPNIPVHFVLEVTGDTQGAVSFEFNFL